MQKSKWLILVAIFIFIGAGNVGASEWEVRDSQTTDDINKPWTITFSSEVDEDSINNNNVYVEVDNKRLNNNVQIGSEPNKVIIESPIGGYEEGKSYTLFIKDVESKVGKKLSLPVKMDFVIQQNLMKHSTLLVANGAGIKSKYIGQLPDNVKYLKIDLNPESQYSNGRVIFNKSFSNFYFFKIPDQQEELEVSLKFTFLDAQDNIVAVDEQKFLSEKTKVQKSINLKELKADSGAEISPINDIYVGFSVTKDMNIEGNKAVFFTAHMSNKEFTIDQALKELKPLYYFGNREDIKDISLTANGLQEVIKYDQSELKDNKLYTMLVIYDESFNAIGYVKETIDLFN